ncbi:hypothetical protein [Streptacidiphilus monticola]|uniref:Uncharacterized protein n=1 Tax=Streptacidiphilus monticola TaxID=2161674 RepID=A0ABW1G926_9ACTN
MDFDGRGFWSRDSLAEVWLYLLAEEAGRVVNPPAWLTNAREDWKLQATGGFIGCVSPGLDKHLAPASDRAAVTLALSERVRHRLMQWRPAIPRAVANSFGAGGEQAYFTTDLDTAPLLAFADAFMRLLRGESPEEPDISLAK